MSTPITINNNRIYSMDALRALAMFLGVLLHAAIAYTVWPFEGFYHDPAYSSKFFDFIYFSIHSFRMQLFYLIAGFFFRLLYLKIGPMAFMKHRTQRILLPFLVGLFTILPLTYLPAVLYRISDAGAHFNSSDIIPVIKDIFIWRGPLHLWFLYYLMIFYIAGIFIRRSGIPLQTKNLHISKLLSDIPMWLKPMLLVLFSFLTLLLFDTFFIQFSPGLIPRASYLLYYGLFFYAGWQLHLNMHTYFPLLRKYCLLFAGIGFITICYVYIIAFSEGPQAGYSTSFLLQAKLFMSIATVSLVLGLLGIFLKWVTAESTVIRYLSDASYWVYLVHVSMVNAIELWFGNSTAWVPLKFFYSFTIPVAVSLITYQLFVRHTFIGYYLHGERKRNNRNKIKEA